MERVRLVGIKNFGIAANWPVAFNKLDSTTRSANLKPEVQGLALAVAGHRDDWVEQRQMPPLYNK